MPLLEVIVNAGSGSFAGNATKQAIEAALEAAAVNARVTLAENGGDVVKAAERSDADVLVASGGDGTINAIASSVIRRGKILGIVPLGTLNHFSNDLGIPPGLDAAAEVLKNGRVERVDVGEVNGQIFLNNSSIGLYPRIVRKRAQQQERLGRGKWYAAFMAAVQVFKRHPFFRVKLDVDGEARRYKTPFVFVGNNEYSMDLYNIGQRERLTDGKLFVHLLRKGGRWGVIRLLLRTLFGMLNTMKEFETITAESVTIEMRKKRVLVAFDGEIKVMQMPLQYRIRPRELMVIVPDEK